MQHTYHNVKEFHRAFGAPIGSEANPSLDAMGQDRINLRLTLIEEEFTELCEAVVARDLVGVADALADLEYVVNGFAVEAGIPLDIVADEVHQSNMSKLDENGDPILRADGKILKGPLFREPDIAGLLRSVQRVYDY